MENKTTGTELSNEIIRGDFLSIRFFSKDGWGQPINLMDCLSEEIKTRMRQTSFDIVWFGQVVELSESPQEF